MQQVHSVGAIDVAIGCFAEYAGINSDESKRILERFYDMYVPRRMRNEIFWVEFALAVNEEYNKFYKPKDLEKEFLYLMGRVNDANECSYRAQLRAFNNV